jgi:[acyl-carrier-protein] S-malonyltransferase
MTTVCVFPGQGSQSIGMLAALAERRSIVRDVFSQCSDAIGIDLWATAQTGPESDLNSTINTQPVLLAAGVGVFQAWIAAGGKLPSALAGHSLGEYCALVCAGSLHLSAAAKIVRERGRLMQAAVPEGQGAMAAVLNADLATLAAVCAEVSTADEPVVPANLNAPGQIVISGHANALARALEALAAAGIKRAIRLPVSVPSHSPLMRDAAEQLREFLGGAVIMPPHIPVIHNCDVASHREPQAIRDALVQQLYSPVRWIETIESLAAQGVATAYECGPGKVLCGMIKRIAPGMTSFALGEPDAVTAALAA